MDTTSLIDRVDERLSELESHVAQLDLIQQLLLRLMSITHPLATALAQYGATSSQEQELLEYLDQLAERVNSLERNRPSFDQFQARIAEIIPALKDDREFLRLIIDTLRVERAAYRSLHDYMVGQGWSARTR